MTSRFRRAGRAARIAGTVALGVSAMVPAPALAQSAPQVSAAWIESLCPAPFSNEFALGKTEEEQAASALALFESPGKARAPFTSGSGVYTPWSRRLAGLSWESELEYGDHMQDWRDALGATLEEGGWSWREEIDFGDGPGWSAMAFEKPVLIDGEERTFIFRFDTFDKYSADCGEAEMLALFKREQLWELEPGSPRPADPGPPQDEAAYLARFDCEDPELVEAFAKAQTVEVAGPLAESLASPPIPYNAQQQYQERLGIWLFWTILQSGKTTEDDLTTVLINTEDGPAIDYEERLSSMVGGMEAIFEGLDNGDGAKTCAGYRAMMQSSVTEAKQQTAKQIARNASLIAEAQRLGVAID